MFDRESYAYYKAHGICVKCRREDAVKGKVLCRACAERHSAYSKQRYAALSEEEKNEYRRKSVENRKLLVARLKEHGICVQCGKSKARRGFVTCKACAEKMREYKKRMKAKQEGKTNG